MTLLEIYEQTIKPLLAQDRLRIASFILNDIGGGAVDASGEWSDKDRSEFTIDGWKHIDTALGEWQDAETG